MTESEVTESNQVITEFELTEFNQVRHIRGAEAARFTIKENGQKVTWLWMSVRDIRLNIRDFGAHSELLRGLKSYRLGKLADKEVVEGSNSNGN